MFDKGLKLAAVFQLVSVNYVFTIVLDSVLKIFFLPNQMYCFVTGLWFLMEPFELVVSDGLGRSPTPL